MANKHFDTHNPDNENTGSKSEDKNKFPGYPDYPESEDILNHAKKIHSGDVGDIPDLDEDLIRMNDLDINEEDDSMDLDVPGADLDDDMEDLGSEDEENNYYSLGGDDHDDLEEDRGE